MIHQKSFLDTHQVITAVGGKKGTRLAKKKTGKPLGDERNPVPFNGTGGVKRLLLTQF